MRETEDAFAGEGEKSVDSRRGSQTLDRGLQVLETVAAAAQPISTPEIATSVGLHRTVVHRLAGTLAARGYLQTGSDGRHRLGGTFLAMRSNACDLSSVARPYLEEIVRRTEETVHLAMLSGSDVIFVDGIESPRALRVASRVGRRLPAHSTSVGKCLLAALDEDGLRRLYPTEELGQVTSHTITRRTELQATLSTVRRQGYASNEGEGEPGVGSVGALIRDRSGEPRAALGVGAPMVRLTPAATRLITELVVSTAKQMGDQLR
ncbi:IclR family transcriptional regulator [Streptomyces sp. NPDC091217]|uniref:IclR family transcriptional regulator n=1 Tax=Streptomyces sp. NPDC091217 TaxID=3365975 RepID=UPI0038028D4D